MPVQNTLRGVRLLALGTCLGSIALLAACNSSGTAVACTAESAQQPVVDIVKNELEKRVSRALRREGGASSSSKIRAAIAELTIGLEDIRTSKVDPNSTKRFCAGTLGIRFPTKTLADADDARQAADLNSVSDMADAADVERNADRFSTDIEFNVQPTDAGDKVFAETESGNNMFEFAAELLSSSLLRAATEDSRRAEQQVTEQAAVEQNAAVAEQRNANLASVRAENQLATQTINAVWKGIPAGMRGRLLPLQRAWVRKKTADCRVEAAAASTDPTDRESARLACDTRLTGERVGYLNQFRGEEPVTPPPEELFEDDTMMNQM